MQKKEKKGNLSCMAIWMKMLFIREKMGKLDLILIPPTLQPNNPKQRILTESTVIVTVATIALVLALAIILRRRK
jgi:hypothetical protein